MAELDPNLLFTALGAIVGWIFATFQFIMNRRDRKEDALQHQKDLAEERKKFQIQVVRPHPVVDVSCETYGVGENQYILSRICVNNLGKEPLTIDQAVHCIDLAKPLSNKGFYFHKIDSELAQELLEIGEDIPLETCQKKFRSKIEIKRFDYLTEYLEKSRVSVAYNEHLRSDKLHLVREPGFYRVTILVHQADENLGLIYNRSKILFVPPQSPVSR